MAGEIDEIKARIDIVDLISEYIHLKQAGTNWKGLCPFHNEKTPSFMASRDKQIWHCFGCGEGGDIFTFIQKTEALEFGEALKLLAQKAGVKLEERDPQLVSQKNRLLDICQLAANLWHKILLESPQGQKARDYLKGRGIEEKIIIDFKLGYAPDSWDTTLKFLKDRGFNDNEIFLAGLTVKKDRGTGFYDRFRDRIVFPVNDSYGRPVGFSARTLKSDEGAKYINTPQTMIYNKSLVIYNLDRAKNEIKKQDLAIMVEGQIDVISAWQVGTQNVIASSGTALTIDQVSILKRFSNVLAIAFDTDSAGQSAAKRGIDIALNQELDVKVIVLPQGKDPDECIKNNPDDWFGAIKNAKSILQYYFDQTTQKVNLGTVDGKKQAAKILLPVIAKIGSQIEQTHWLQQLSGLINVSEQILRETLQPSKSPKSAHQPATLVADKKDRSFMVSEQVLAIVLKYPRHLPHLVDALEPEMIPDKRLQTLYSQLILYYTKDINSTIDNFDYQQFLATVNDQASRQLADTLVFLAEKDFDQADHEAIRNELNVMTSYLKKYFYTTKLKVLEAEIKQAENAGDKQELGRLSQTFDQVVSQLNILK